LGDKYVRFCVFYDTKIRVKTTITIGNKYIRFNFYSCKSTSQKVFNNLLYKKTKKSQ
jgi:hypothetical protein